MSATTVPGAQSPTQPRQAAALDRLAEPAAWYSRRSWWPTTSSGPALRALTPRLPGQRLLPGPPRRRPGTAGPDLAGFTLFLFAAGLWARARQEESRWWAGVGVLGAATIAALFAIVNITEIVLTAKAARLASSPAVVQALWTLRAAAFGLDLAAVGVALIGLSRAAAAMRLIPSWLALTAWPGAACLLIAAVFTVALADGGPWLAVGLAGFIVWVVFVITASVSLLRGRQIP